MVPFDWQQLTAGITIFGTGTMRASRSEYLTIQGLRYHVRHWGNEGAPKLFMVHGWMDMSASFQFVVDCLQQDWHVIAPDLRGFGLTERVKAATYWYPDYIADLDALFNHYAPDETVDLIGHSMGGNITCLYSGIRPYRIRKLVNLEGFGMPDVPADRVPLRYAQWLDELQNPPRMSTYASQADVARRLQLNNKRLTDERAAFLAQHWSAQTADGRWEILGDPLHKGINPLPFRVAEAAASWQRVTAPVLWVEAEDPEIIAVLQRSGPLDRAEIDRRIACFRDIRTLTIADAGHMLHHDQPAAVAAAIEQFLVA